MTAANPALESALRVGAVRYLNSRPLIERLADHLPPGGRLTLDYPSRLADDLRSGRLDVALVPSVAALSLAGAEILPDACVAARGPVRSVKVYFRRAPGEVRTLALDEGSRTSAALARALLAERYGVTPTRTPLPLAPTATPDAAAVALRQTDADAVLLIGDRAMKDPPGRFAAVWDLGEQWNAWTGLPFVFAAWTARPGLSDSARELAAAATRAARDRGVSRLDRLAAEAGPPLGLTADDARDYLSRNLHFTLGPAERAGLSLFRDLCERNGLLSPSSPPTAAASRRFRLPAASTESRPTSTPALQEVI